MNRPTPPAGMDVAPAVTMPNMVMVDQTGPGFLLRAVWFVFIGWWLSGLAIAFGYALMLTVLLIPVGFLVLNLVPVLQTLRPRQTRMTMSQQGADLLVQKTYREQIPFGTRAVYFVLVGWWASGVWIGLAYVLSLTILLLPVSIMMLNRIPEVLTLRRS